MYRQAWSARPSVPPVFALVRSGLARNRSYASWNGATEVASWRVLAGASPQALHRCGHRSGGGLRDGDRARLACRRGFVQVQALDASGAVLGASAVRKRLSPGFSRGGGAALPEVQVADRAFDTLAPARRRLGGGAAGGREVVGEAAAVSRLEAGGQRSAQLLVEGAVHPFAHFLLDRAFAGAVVQLEAPARGRVVVELRFLAVGERRRCLLRASGSRSRTCRSGCASRRRAAARSPRTARPRTR